MRRSGVEGIKLYHFDEPGLADRQIYWELRHAFQPLWESEEHCEVIFHRWWKRAFARHLKETIEALGLDADHLRVSVRQAHALGLDMEVTKWCAAEAIGSTDFVVLALGTFACKMKRRVSKDCAQAILKDFLVCTLPNDMAMGSLAWPEEGPPLLPALCEHANESGRQCRHIEDLEAPTNEFEVAGFVLSLVARSLRCDLAKEWLARVLNTLHEAIDARVIQGVVGRNSPENFPVLRGRKRARRLDKNIGAHAAEAVAAKRFRSTARMGACGNIPVPKQTARSVDSQTVVDYVYSVRDLSSQSSQLQVSLDASVIAGEDTLFMAAWWHRLQKGAWLVPQVPLSLRHAWFVLSPIGV